MRRVSTRRCDSNHTLDRTHHRTYLQVSKSPVPLHRVILERRSRRINGHPGEAGSRTSGDRTAPSRDSGTKRSWTSNALPRLSGDSVTGSRWSVAPMRGGLADPIESDIPRLAQWVSQVPPSPLKGLRRGVPPRTRPSRLRHQACHRFLSPLPWPLSVRDARKRGAGRMTAPDDPARRIARGGQSCRPLVGRPRCPRLRVRGQHIRHPAAGDSYFHIEIVSPAQEPDQRLVVTVQSHSQTARLLPILGSW